MFIQNDYSSEPSICPLASLAVLFLSLAKGVFVLGNSADYTNSIGSVSDVVSMSLWAASALAILCFRPSRLAPLGLIHVSSSSDYSSG